MSKLAAEHQSVNLGQGFPDDEGPESMKQVGDQERCVLCVCRSHLQGPQTIETGGWVLAQGGCFLYALYLPPNTQVYTPCFPAHITSPFTLMRRQSQ